MQLSALSLIIITTVLASIRAFNNRELMDKYLNIPYRYKHNNEYYRIISHLFIHADAQHLIFNMISLHFIGVYLENDFILRYGFVVGEIYFVGLYLFGGVFATLIPFVRNQDNLFYRSLGASGAVSAVIFATILWIPKLELGILFIPVAIPGYIFGPAYLFIEYLADKRGNTGVAHDAHIGGALFGVAYALILDIEKGKFFLDLLVDKLNALR